MPCPVRVLHILDNLDLGGGAQRSLAALVPYLRTEGIEVHVAYLGEREHSVAEDLRSAGVTVHSVAGPGGRMANAVRIARLARQVRPDLVHTTLFEADQAGRVGARLAGLPVVSSLVNLAYGADQAASPGLRPWKVRAAREVDALTARLAVRFHAVAGHIADAMASRLRVSRARIDVVHRGRDASALGRRTMERRQVARSQIGISEKLPLIVAVGRQEWQKGHDVLLAAVPRLLPHWPDLVVAIAGREGAQTGSLRAAIEAKNLARHVRLLGRRDDVAELLCAADAFACPSRWEGLPGAVLEAMALETPVVASDIPAVREVTTADSALLVPPGEPAPLAAALADCLGRRDAARRRTSVARRRFLDSFTIARSAAGMVAFYDRALALSRASRRL
jgi:glycosyltransferase involved in cell wall biosynthesis